MANTSDSTHGENPPDPPNAHFTDNAPSPFPSAAEREDIRDANLSDIDKDMYIFDPSLSDPDPNPNPDTTTRPPTLNKPPTFDSDTANSAIGAQSASFPTPAADNDDADAIDPTTVDTTMHKDDEVKANDTINGHTATVVTRLHRLRIQQQSLEHRFLQEIATER